MDQSTIITVAVTTIVVADAPLFISVLSAAVLVQGRQAGGSLHTPLKFSVVYLGRYLRYQYS